MKIYLSFLLPESFEIGSERDAWTMWTQTGRGLRYGPFLNSCCDSKFRALHPCFFDRRFSTGVHQCCLSILSARQPLCKPLDCLNFFWQLNDYHWPWVLVYIYFHNTYVFRLLTHMICLWLSTHVRYFLLFTQVHPAHEIPLIDSSVKQNHIIVYRLLVLDRYAWYHITICK